MPGHFQIQVRDIQKGDKYRGINAADSEGWDAVSDAEVTGDMAMVKVRHHPDGGLAFRQWDDDRHVIAVLR